jgi:acetyltransferase-like isoleucine patch superfamily enzyme
MVSQGHQAWKIVSILKILWTLFSSFVVESIVFGCSALPGVLFWEWHYHWHLPGPEWLRLAILSMAFIPAYFIFAITLMVLSALATKILGWRAPLDCEMPISRPHRPLMNWVRYSISIHLVRIFAGSVFRATPAWTLYMRMNGAKLGRRVWVNSLWVTDHNLLEFGDDVVIGSEVHLSGHTVEGGVVKTARVRLGAGVTVGVSTIVEIGVEAGPGCQIGALSFVPKYAKLEAGKIYAGSPVHLIESHRPKGLS